MGGSLQLGPVGSTSRFLWGGVEFLSRVGWLIFKGRVVTYKRIARPWMRPLRMGGLERRREGEEKEQLGD